MVQVIFEKVDHFSNITWTTFNISNTFNKYEDFLYFFSKYSLSLIDYNKMLKLFKESNCEQKKFEDFITDLLNKNKNLFNKLQNQTDIILDYCYLNPNKIANNYKAIERLYVLRRISPNLTLLNENKAASKSAILLFY